MPIIIDIVIVAILAIFLIVGIKRGFLLMLLPLLLLSSSTQQLTQELRPTATSSFQMAQ